ncbi:MAG: GNAT family protein [Sphingomonas fennica]
MTDAFARALADGDLRLIPFTETHRAGLKDACAEDAAIWDIYPTSFAPDRFDATLDGVLATPTRRPLTIQLGEAIVGMTGWLALGVRPGTIEIGGSYLRPAARGTGLNARIKRLMLDHAFAHGIRRVEFRVDTRNGRSMAAVAKIGGVLEGVLRQDAVTWTGHVRDAALFSILRDEWTAG